MKEHNKQKPNKKEKGKEMRKEMRKAKQSKLLQNKNKDAISCDTISYEDINQSYDSLYRAEQYRKYNAVLSMIEIKKTDNLLDVGCGTGMFFEFLETANIECSKQGIDNSKGMIEHCKEKGFTCELSAAEKLSFPDKQFDIIICISAIHNFENPEKAIKEMKRVCKDDGMIVMTVLRRSEKYEEICRAIKKQFKIVKKIKDQQDDIFSLSPL